MDDVDFRYFTESPKWRCLEKHVKVNFPALYKKLQQIPGNKYSEKIYRYFHPDVKNECVVCGNPTKFKSITCGFFRTCCINCATKDPLRNEKSKQTCVKKYGVENPSQAESIKKKKEETCLKNYGVKSGLCNRDKIIATNIERYGVENPSQAESIKKKKEETCLKNYGVRNPLMSPDVRSIVSRTKMERYGDVNYNNREKASNTMEQLYGVRNAFNIPGVFEAGLRARIEGDTYIRVAANNIKRCLDAHPDVIGVNNGVFTCRCEDIGCVLCTEKTFEITPGVYAYRTSVGAEKCTIKNPVGRSNSNTSIEIFIENLLISHGIDYEKHNRKILSGRELDFCVPTLNIAIECNGCYWHSDKYKAVNYHKEKFEACKIQGIQLLTVWEDWVANKPAITESLVLSKFGIYKERIGARKCRVVEVSSKKAQQFFEDNHIQGKCKSKVRVGLVYNGRLVAVMAFNNRSKLSGGPESDGWELIRFCSLLNRQVVGGAERLLKHFISQYKPSKIVSFSSNDISTGQLYKRLNFKEYSSSLAYWYIQQGSLKRYHRTSFCKTRLREMGFDITRTEREIMESLPYWRIYDSGTTGWRLII